MDTSDQEEKQEQLVQQEHMETELQLHQLKQLHVQHVKMDITVQEEQLEQHVELER
jgi:hypothetical protein